jgi:dipeptidyl aminopeptidase/acylaminoacyl peptidase
MAGTKKENFGERIEDSLCVIDIETGRHDLLLGSKEALTIQRPMFSPNGGKILVSRKLKPDPRARTYQSNYEILVIDLSDGSVTTAVERTSDIWGMSHGWSPDEKWIGYSTDDFSGKSFRWIAKAEEHATPVACEVPESKFHYSGNPSTPPVWAPDSQEVCALSGTDLHDFDVKGRVVRTVNLEDLGGDGVAWGNGPLSSGHSPDSKTRVVFGKEKVATIEISTGTVRAVPMENGFPRPSSNHFTTTVHGDKMFYQSGSIGGGIALYSLDVKTGKVERLTTVAKGFSEFTLGSTKKIEWLLPDGKPCQGTLLLPSDYKQEERIPIIFDVYAGKTGNGGLSAQSIDGRGTTVSPLVLAANGFGVFYPDIPLSAPDPNREIPAILEPAVRKLIEEGYGEPGRFGVIGNSYGGYTVFSLATQTNQFAAGVACNGFHDLVRYAASGMFTYAETGQGKMKTSLWDNPEKYIVFTLFRVSQNPNSAVAHRRRARRRSQGPVPNRLHLPAAPRKTGRVPLLPRARARTARLVRMGAARSDATGSRFLFYVSHDTRQTVKATMKMDTCRGCHINERALNGSS